MTDCATANPKERLERLLNLAQAYRGWTRRELARSLGRDPTKLLPSSGNPKLDLVVNLADALDWPVEEVSGWLSNGRSGKKASREGKSFEALDELALEAHRLGDYRKMITLAHRALDVASTTEERARAYNRAAGGWDGIGRFQKVLLAAQAGLREHPIAGDLKLLLQTTAANAYYTLWQLDEAEAMARRVIAEFDARPPATDRGRVADAHAWYVLGHTLRRLLDVEPDRAATHAAAACEALEQSATRYEAIADDIHESYGGIAHTCRGGILEAKVSLGLLDPRAGIARIVDSFAAVVDTAASLTGDWLESHGWWSIFGCNITLRHITDERDLQRFMALFTNKADEIADHLDHWALRERVFAMQFEGHQRLIGWTGQEVPVVIDNDDVRLITGTMGRFPRFRETGWSILNAANIISEA